MIKKIILILFLFCMMTSCGKKSDPVFKESKKERNLENILITKA
tara:strand:- start:332 stop:463 length:132 start_codon:yes stop_codon:yes gene_type:complete